MSLSAYVQFDSDQLVGKADPFSEGEVLVAQQIAPAWVEITEGDGGVSLASYCNEGNLVTHTRHKNIKEAKQRAERDFGILEENWFEEDTNSIAYDL